MGNLDKHIKVTDKPKTPETKSTILAASKKLRHDPAFDEMIKSLQEMGRNEANKICQEVSKSGILTSPKYKKLVKKLQTNIANQRKKAEYDSTLEDKGEITIKGKNGKQYKVALSSSETMNETSATSDRKSITFLNDKAQKVEITVRSNNSVGENRNEFLVTLNGKTIIFAQSHLPDYSSSDVFPHNDETNENFEARKAKEDEEQYNHTKKQNNEYDKALSKPNIREVVKALGGELESPTKTK